MNSMTRKAPVACAVAAAAAVALAGCSSSGSSASTTSSTAHVSGGTADVALPPAVTANYIFPFSGLANFSQVNISDLQQPMYRPLYYFGGENTEPTLSIADSPAQQPVYGDGGRTVTITMKGWSWSNGEKVDADDVVFWMNMMRAEKANWAGYTPGLFPDNVASVTKVDDDTVRMTMKKAFSSDWFTYNELSQVTPMPMAWDITHTGAAAGSGGCTTSVSRCKAVYTFLAGQAKKQDTYATSPVWSVVDGPFKLSAYSAQGQYSFVPNPSYGGKKPSLDTVTFLPYTSDSAEFNALKSSSTLQVGYIPSQDLPQKSAGSAVPSTNPVGSGFTLEPSYPWSVNYWPLNFGNPTLGPVFKQLYFRQAMAEVLDQSVDVQKAYRGYAIANYSPVPAQPSNPWLSPTATSGAATYPFDTATAKQLLTSHGWTEESGVMTCTSPGTGASSCGTGIAKGTKLDIAYDYASGTPALTLTMEQLKSDASLAGIDLKMTQKPFNTVIAEAVPCTPKQASCSWQMANWGGGWIYAPDYLPTGESLFQTGAGSNSGNYSDAQMDKLIAATTTTSGTAPIFAYSDYTAKQLPVIFQANPYTIYAVAKSLGGVVFNPLLSLNAEYWYRTK